MEVETHLGDADLSQVKTRSVKGVITLISRSFIQRLISTVGFILLSAFLGIPEIGLFIAVNDLVSILGYFSDIGLAASLIQKKEKVSIEDLRTTFTLQQCLVGCLVLIAVIISPFLIKYYQIEGGGVFLFFSLLLAFILSSLKTIPSVTLERQLRFEILATVEVVENLIFYVVAVLLAWKGAGVSAYAIAVLLRGIVGTALLYRLAPWPIGFGFSRSSLKSLLSFGLPYQLNSLMAVVKDRFVNIVLWRIIGAGGVGTIGWAQSWAQLPLRFIMDNVTKVTFPAYSRMQSHPEELRRAIEKSLFFITLLTFPILAALSTLTPVLLALIPRYQKWEVALVPLVLYSFNSALAAISTPLTNTLNAIGKVKINTYLMIMWTLLTWALTPLLAIKYGYLGVAYATGIIALSSLVPIIVVQRLTHFSLVRSVLKPLLAVIVMILITLYLRSVLPVTFANLTVMIVVSGLVYLLVCLALVGQELVTDTRKLLNIRFTKKNPHA